MKTTVRIKETPAQDTTPVARANGRGGITVAAMCNYRRLQVKPAYLLAHHELPPAVMSVAMIRVAGMN